MSQTMDSQITIIIIGIAVGIAITITIATVIPIKCQANVYASSNFIHMKSENIYRNDYRF